MKKIICQHCQHVWYVKGVAVPFSSKLKIDRSLLKCEECGADNSKKALIQQIRPFTDREVSE